MEKLVPQPEATQMSYDSWLEEPYQRECARADAYEAALDVEQQRIMDELQQLTIKELLAQYNSFSAPIPELLTNTNRARGSELTRVANYNWSVENIIQALAYDLAEKRLQAKPEPDEPDFDLVDLNKECTYWEQTK